ncbi:MAG: lasso RiPP family leader peptide-containing protein [Coriobacteriales bacterium]|nr:lasso RiPP family leader peptide-containing protein [Coriobacteriales bacterium]
MRRHLRDAVFAKEDVAPVLVEIGSVREDTRHTDDGYRHRVRHPRGRCCQRNFLNKRQRIHKLAAIVDDLLVKLSDGCHLAS